MKFFVVLILNVLAVFADVSHIKLDTDRHYLPPERALHASHHQHEEQHHYTHSKPKAIPDPHLVVVPHRGLNTFVADLPLRQQLFTPAGDSGGDFNQAQGSDHVVYATAPNSVFQTQINVQSQGSEFHVPKSDFDDDESRRRIAGGVRSGDSSFRNQHHEHHEERTYKQETHKPTSYREDHNKRTHQQSEYSRSYDGRTDYQTKRPNHQGLNLINGNIAADQAALLPTPPNNLNGNSQGINIINGNLLGKHEHASHSPQFGYKPKQYEHEHNYEHEHEHDKSRSSPHKTEDVYRKTHTHTSHHEHHDEHSKKIGNHSPRQYGDHKEFDYHKSRSFSLDGESGHNYKENHHDHHVKKHEDDHDRYERTHTHHKHENEHEKHDQRNDHKNEHHEHHKQRDYHEHSEHHDQREHHDHHRHRHEHHEQHDHKEQREYHDHPKHHDQREQHEHHDHHEQREHHDHPKHHDQQDHHEHEHRHHHEYHDNRDHRDQHHHHDHHDNYQKNELHNRQHQAHEKTYRKEHDALDIPHQRDYASDLHHEKTKHQNSIISKPAIKIIAFNNNNQPNFQVSPVQAQIPIPTSNENTEEFDPSASEPVLIYKPGDEIDFAETKLIDYQDNRRPLESYSYIRKKPQQKTNQPIIHGETDLHKDGYHYGKPSVNFDF